MGCRSGAPGADLLAYGKDKPGVIGQGLGQQLEHDGAAHPVVQRLGLDTVYAEGQEGAVEHYGVAGHGQSLRFLFALAAQVYIKAAEGGGDLAFLRRGEMDGLQRNDAGGLFPANAHPAADEHPGIHAAHGGDMQHTVLRDVPHQKAHLVHVRTDHHGAPAGFFALFEHEQAAQRIGEQLVCKGPGLLLDKGADLVLIACHAVQLAKLS